MTDCPHVFLRKINGGKCPKCAPRDAYLDGIRAAAPPIVEPFAVVAADPAWSFDDKLPGEGRGAEKHYDVMSAADIAALTLPPIAPDAHLFLWRVSALQREALNVVDGWNFTVKSELVWLKRTKNGKEHFGMGRQVRLAHEICLICTRGKGAGIKNRSQRSTFTTEHDLDDPTVLESLERGELGNYMVTDEHGGAAFTAKMPTARTGATCKDGTKRSRITHSKKPDEFFRIVEDLVDSDRRVELFARSSRPGWVAIGNEVAENPITMTVAQ